MLSETKSRYAGKKLIIYLTIVSMLNLVGCYYQQQMTPEEENFTDKKDIKVTTTDTVYTFKGDDYYYSNDTLFASVAKPLDERSNFEYIMSIPVDKIEKLEVEKMNTTGTIIIVVTIALVAVGITLWGLYYEGTL